MEIVVRVPTWTPANAVVYLAGEGRELGHWVPDGVRLRRRRDGTWGTRVRVGPGDRVQCKVTLGTWDRVEKDASGRDVGNRVLTYQQAVGGETVLMEVGGWGEPTARRHTIVGELVGHDRFYARALGNFRTVWVWLPPGYRERTDAAREIRYPVLYMHDGQNLFDDARAAFGVEWGVDETATNLIGQGIIPPMIVVGIENTADRFGEYTPTMVGGVGGRGTAYGRFLVDEVKAFVDAHYRTSPAPRDTFVAGSSLGGLISLYLLREYPQVFGGAAALSPSLWWHGEKFLKEAETDARWAVGKKIWIDTGTAESGWGEEMAHCARVLRLKDALIRHGLTEGETLVTQIIEDAMHNEAAWGLRLPEVLTHLLGT